MKSLKLKFCTEVNNCPGTCYDYSYIVARLVDSELWYYGNYEEEKAYKVAKELGNAVVVTLG